MFEETTQAIFCVDLKYPLKNGFYNCLFSVHSVVLQADYILSNLTSKLKLWI